MSTTEFNRVQDQSIEFVRQGQHALVDSVRAWSETVSRLVPGWPTTGWWPRPQEAVDVVFDIAEQTLATQREVARQVLGAATAVTEAATEQAEQVKQAQEAEQAKQAKQAQEAEQAEQAKQAEKFESMTVEQLQDEAAKAGIEGRSQMNKQELVKALRKK